MRQLSDFIGDFKYEILEFSFGEFDVSPFKEIGAALACPSGISKMAAK